MLIAEPWEEVVGESAKNMITEFTARQTDLEVGNLIHDLLNMKTFCQQSFIFDHRLTCEHQHKKGESNSKLSKWRKTTSERRKHTVHKQNNVTTQKAHCP